MVDRGQKCVQMEASEVGAYMGGEFADEGE